jgi:hypothetical protein
MWVVGGGECPAQGKVWSVVRSVSRACVRVKGGSNMLLMWVCVLLHARHRLVVCWGKIGSVCADTTLPPPPPTTSPCGRLALAGKRERWFGTRYSTPDRSAQWVN